MTRAMSRSPCRLGDLRFETILANGMALSSKFSARPESHGGASATFTVNHEDDDGIAHLRSQMRLQFYPGHSFVKLHHRLEVISPALAPALGGELPPDCSADMRENIVGDSGEESALLKLRSFCLQYSLCRRQIRAASRRRLARGRQGRGDLAAAPRS